MTSNRRIVRLVSALAVAFGTSAAFAQKAQTPPPQTPPQPKPQQEQPAAQPTVQLPTTLPGTPQNTPHAPAPRPFDSVVKEATEIPRFLTL